MSATLSNQQHLQEIEHQIGQSETLAKAEQAFTASTPDARNPWQGESEKLAALRGERENLRLRIAGEKLSAALAHKRELEERLDRLMVARRVADREVAERLQHPTVQRYLNAGTVCRRHGWAHSFEIFSQWFESKRERWNAAPECATFFLDSTDAEVAGVRFDTGPERTAVHLYLQAKDHATRLVSEWCLVAEQLRALLREHPELGQVA